MNLSYHNKEAILGFRGLGGRAVKGFNLSYQNKDTILCNIDP